MERFDEGRFRALLGDPELPIYHYESLDSSNLECRRLRAKGAARALVLTDEQTAGRGRLGRSFFSPAGCGLYLSLLLSPAGGPVSAAGITTYAAVCTAEAIEAVAGLSCQIKWVNDLYLDGRKVCGILTEAVEGAVIVGIGVNLTPAAVPEALREIVGCLDREGIRDPLAARIARAVLAYVPGDAAHMDGYRRRSLVLGRRVAFTREGRDYTGVAAEILDDGGLAVDTDGGGRMVLRSGEVSLTGVQGLPARN